MGTLALSVQQQVAVWFRSQRMNVASWYSASYTKACISLSLLSLPLSFFFPLSLSLSRSFSLSHSLSLSLSLSLSVIVLIAAYGENYWR
jgi:hypothetical protein